MMHSSTTAQYLTYIILIQGFAFMALLKRDQRLYRKKLYSKPGVTLHRVYINIIVDFHPCWYPLGQPIFYQAF